MRRRRGLVPNLFDLESGITYGAAVLRVLMDSNGVDPIIELPGALEAIDAAVTSGDLLVLITATSYDELCAAPDLDRRVRLMLVARKAEVVADGAFVVGKSRIGHARVIDVPELEDYETLRAGNDKHIEDAVIVMAAKAEGAVLVTNEKRLPAKALKVGVDSMTADEMLKAIGFVAP